MSVMKLTVATVMTHPVVTVNPETPIKEAVRLLKSHRISGMPVVNAKGGLVGIVTEADLLNKVEKRDPDSYVLESRRHRQDRARAGALDVGSAMSREVTTVRPEFPIALAAREMHTRGFKRMPVVDESGKVIGIVSRGDLLKVFLRTDRELREEVRSILESAASRHGGHGLKARVSGGVVQLQGTFDAKSRMLATARAVGAIDGVVGLKSEMSFELDDTVLPPSAAR
jgi:CBS domain-containing protein